MSSGTASGGVSVQLSNVGKSKRTNMRKVDINIDIRLKRTSSVVESAKLMDEFLQLVDRDIPDFATKLTRIPHIFQYDQAKLNQTQGFPEVARKMLNPVGQKNINKELNNWAKNAQADKGEEDSYNAILRAFSGSAGLFVSGLKKEKMFEVVRRALDFAGNQQGGQSRTGQLTDLEKTFYKMLGIDMDKFIQEMAVFMDKLFPNPSTTSLSEQELKANLKPALRDIKPAYNDLNKEAQKKYREKLDRLIEKSYRARSHHAWARGDVEIALTRHFLVYLDRDDEFDSLLIDPSSSTFLLCETKSWPQDPGVIQTQDVTGLSSNLEKADLQLGRGRDFFNTVLGPITNMSVSWTFLGIIILPNVPSRKYLQGKGVDPAYLNFILTREELTDGESKWKKNLKLGSLKCKDEEYKKAVAVVVGSQKVSFQSQVFNMSAEIGAVVEETVKRITGAPRAVMGLGGWSGDIHQATSDVAQLRGKELGHVHSVMFWNQVEHQVLDSLGKKLNLILCGDFGGGKSSTIIEAAMRAALLGGRNGVTVLFISALDTGCQKTEISGESVFNIALEERFENTSVEVVTTRSMRKELGSDEENVPVLIQEFLKLRGDKKSIQASGYKHG